MKIKQLFLILTFVLLTTIFAVSVNAEEIKRFETDEFQEGDNVTYIDGINEDIYLTQDRYNSFYELLDPEYEARAVVQNSDGTYTTYPSWYFMYLIHYWNGAEYYYTADRVNEFSEVTGETYSLSSIVRFEFPEYKEGHGFAIKTSPNALGMGNVKYVRLATHFTSTGGVFQGTDVQEIVYPDVDTLTAIGSRSFLNCYKIEEIIFPNTITTVGNQAIHFWNGPASNAALKVINLGASLTTLEGNETIKGARVPGLIVYVPETLDGTVYGADCFPETAVIIFTGTKEQAEAFGFASTISYSEYAANNFEASAGTIVYSYSKCEAFYKGAHDYTEPSYAFESYVSGARVSSVCTICGQEDVLESYNPIVYFLGYSFKNDGSAVTLGYRFSLSSIVKHQSMGATFSYGTVVCSSKAEYATTPLQITESGVVAIDEQRTFYTAVDLTCEVANLKVSGIEGRELSLVLCMYVYDGEKIVYLCTTEEGDFVQTDAAYAVTLGSTSTVFED